MTTPGDSLELELGPRPSSLGDDLAGLHLVQSHRLSGAAEVVRWCAAPMLLRAVDGSRTGERDQTNPYLRSFVSLAPVRRGPRYVRQGGLVFASQQGNPLRTLTPVVDLGVQRGIPAEDVTTRGASPLALARYLRAARDAADALCQAARGAGIEPAQGHVHDLMSVAARSLARAERALDHARPRGVVVATQHAIDIRAVIHAARVRHLPVTYLAHAPVAVSPVYADLPVDAAGLRGPAEVAHYEGLGAPADGLHVIGNPAVAAPAAPPAIDLSLPVVFAAPPLERAVLEPFVELIRSAWAGPVVVSPHPQSDLDVLRALARPSWSLWEGGTTFDLLMRGPGCVIQYSSGVVWESLALGLGTVQLAFEGEQPTYPLIREPPVRFAGTTSRLREAIETTLADAQRAEARRELQAWAQDWCHLSGAPAAEASRALVESVTEPRPEPILDAW